MTKVPLKNGTPEGYQNPGTFFRRGGEPRKNIQVKKKLSHKKWIQPQNFKSSKMDKKIDINHLQDLNNVKKTIFHGSVNNLAQNRILKEKKKLPNLPKNSENPRFFEFYKVITWSNKFSQTFKKKSWFSIAPPPKKNVTISFVVMLNFKCSIITKFK